jgi:hypothetical protein
MVATSWVSRVMAATTLQRALGELAHAGAGGGHQIPLEGRRLGLQLGHHLVDRLAAGVLVHHQVAGLEAVELRGTSISVHSLFTASWGCATSAVVCWASIWSGRGCRR